MKCWIYYGLFLLLLTHSYAAPVETEIEEDHELIGGFFQGDMEIELTRNGEIAESKRWPNGIVHYKIDEVFGKRNIKLYRAIL